MARPVGQAGRGGARGLPLVKPPYGEVVAIDLNTGDIAWRAPFGDMPSLRNHPALAGVALPRALGSAGAWGVLVTKSGLVIGGTSDDSALHARDAATGQLHWTLPLAASAGGHPHDLPDQSRAPVRGDRRRQQREPCRIAMRRQIVTERVQAFRPRRVTPSRPAGRIGRIVPMSRRSTSAGPEAGSGQSRPRRPGQGELQHLVHVVDEVEMHDIEDVLRDVREVTSRCPSVQDDRASPRPEWAARIFLSSRCRRSAALAPRSVISPVIATSRRAGILAKAIGAGAVASIDARRQQARPSGWRPRAGGRGRRSGG